MCAAAPHPGRGPRPRSPPAEPQTHGAAGLRKGDQGLSSSRALIPAPRRQLSRRRDSASCSQVRLRGVSEPFGESSRPPFVLLREAQRPRARRGCPGVTPRFSFPSRPSGSPVAFVLRVSSRRRRTQYSSSGFDPGSIDFLYSWLCRGEGYPFCFCSPVDGAGQIIPAINEKRDCFSIALRPRRSAPPDAPYNAQKPLLHVTRQVPPTPPSRTGDRMSHHLPALHPYRCDGEGAFRGWAAQRAA